MRVLAVAVAVSVCFIINWKDLARISMIHCHIIILWVEVKIETEYCSRATNAV